MAKLSKEKSTELEDLKAKLEAANKENEDLKRGRVNERVSIRTGSEEKKRTRKYVGTRKSTLDFFTFTRVRPDSFWQ